MAGGRGAGYARYGNIVPYRGAARGSYGRGGRTIGRGGMMFRARGNMMASKQQRDSAAVVLQGMMNVPISVNTQNANPVSNGAVVGLSIWQLLFNTKFWEHYKEMWDQVKMMGFRCRIIGNSAATTVLASGLSSVGVVTAVDRTSIPGGVIAPVFMPDEQQNGNMKPAIILNPGKAGNSEEMINSALSYGSCKTKNWSPGNAFYQWVSCYPSTMSEKEHWIETDNAIITAGIWQGASGSQRLVMGYPSGLDVESENTALEASGQTRMGSNSTPGFNPVMLLGIYNIPQTTATSAQVFTFSIEYKIPCTFRGARSGNQDAAALVRALAPPVSGQLLEVNITENGDKIFNEGPYDPVIIKTNVTPNLHPYPQDRIEANGTTVIEAGQNDNGEQLYFDRVVVETDVEQRLNELELAVSTTKEDQSSRWQQTRIENGAFWNKRGQQTTDKVMRIYDMRQAKNNGEEGGTTTRFTDDTVNGFIVIMKNQFLDETGGTEGELKKSSEVLIWAYADPWGSMDSGSKDPWDVKGFRIPETASNTVKYATWRWNPEVGAQLQESDDDIVRINISGLWKHLEEDGTVLEEKIPTISIPAKTTGQTWLDAGGILPLFKDAAFKVTEAAKMKKEGEDGPGETVTGLIDIWE